MPTKFPNANLLTGMKTNNLGLIALDIDGTITAEMQAIPASVISFFHHLHTKGWSFVFITGRTYDFGYDILKELPFDYYYAVQNGAILLEMPSEKIISKKYLDKSIFPVLELICEGEETDFVIFAGKEHNNKCFFRPHKFSDRMQTYLQARCVGYGETWTEIETFAELPIHEFPSVKLFGNYEAAMRIAEKIEKELNLHVPVIRDPFDPNIYVIQGTHSDISKGFALRDVIALGGHTGKIIAAGDDLNDLSMYEFADVTIAMGTAPEVLKNAAMIVAPAAHQQGIIEALQKAIQ